MFSKKYTEELTCEYEIQENNEYICSLTKKPCSFINKTYCIKSDSYKNR